MKNDLEITFIVSITAHTGCEETPDNSLESIDKAFNSGADIFEVDVRFDKSGVPVLTHDEPVGGEPTLEAAFERLARYKNMRCNIDVKCTDNIEAIVPLAKKRGVLDRVFYTGINESFVESAKRTPEIPYYLNAEISAPEEQSPEYLALLVGKVRASGAIGINCRYDNATKELISAFRQNSLLVSLWTVNEEEDMQRVLSLAPDNITTRKPSALRNLLNEAENQ